jgi:hypothetical protein
MDVIFRCSNPDCQQELSVDTAGAGSEIQCPSCGMTLVVPASEESASSAPPPAAAYEDINPIHASAAAKEVHHFVVPEHEKAPKAQITKPLPPLEVSAKEGDKKMRIRCIRRTDCVEVGKDKFEEVVGNFLAGVGEANIVSIDTINYTHQDMGTRQILTEYGVLIVYKG